MVRSRAHKGRFSGALLHEHASSCDSAPTNGLCDRQAKDEEKQSTGAVNINEEELTRTKDFQIGLFNEKKHYLAVKISSDEFGERVAILLAIAFPFLYTWKIDSGIVVKAISFIVAEVFVDICKSFMCLHYRVDLNEFRFNPTLWESLQCVFMANGCIWIVVVGLSCICYFSFS